MGYQNGIKKIPINYQLIYKYFNPDDSMRKALLSLLTVSILTACICFANHDSGGNVIAVGVVALLLSVLFIWLLIRMKDIPDRVVDDVAKSQLISLRERAFDKLGIDEDEVNEIPPIVFHGYDYSIIADGVTSNGLGATYYKFGKDCRLRTNQYRVVMLYFSANEMYCYEYNFSLTENSQRESTDTYFYRDIVSLSTQTETANVGAEKRKYNYENFRLTTTGGTSISCSVREDEVEDAQRSIKGMRSLLKEKKMS